ncbi:hypothetical protein V6N13_048323 [Hibiscus sabdariffa]|uniref:Cytochrome c oxidase assembly factor 3 mitochondrial coiled-coil domain-containing protein n=1 Tax=Hibiscus sabdariffa TaxID=183260 RepID=A0ABR2F6W1_9ROSI
MVFLFSSLLNSVLDQTHYFFGILSFQGVKTFKKLSASEMAGPFAYSSLAPKTKNLVVAGGLTAFVFGVYFYTMRAVGGTDELQVAIDKFEELKKQEAKSNIGSKA